MRRVRDPRKRSPLVKYGHHDSFHMASRRGYSAFLIAASLLMLSGLSVLYLATDGSDATEGDYGNYHWVMDDGKNLTVTGHGDLNTFQSGWNGLVTLTLVPDGAVNIGDYVLQDCGSLTTVTINGSVESIGEGVFYDCGSLTTVSIDGSVGSIGVGAFYHCDSLTTVTIDGSVGSIGVGALENCDSLTTVTIDGSVGSIGDRAFYHCDSLTTVTINGSVGSIGDHAFEDCNSLTTVTIDGSVGPIGDHAFEDCNSLTTVTIDGSVGSIGDHAFYDCDSLETVTIAGPITPPIGEDAFLSCNNLMTVNIACNDPLGITAQSSANGYIAYYADTVNKVHRYSATYDWVDDGSSCTVHIVCANTSDHDHDVTDSLITSTVKIPPTATEKGTTEYTVSGTYDGFSYSDTKDIQDIPAIGGDSGGKDSNILIYVAIAVIAALAIACAVILYIRSRR